MSLACGAGKINQILRCDWLPEWARYGGDILTTRGLRPVCRKKNLFFTSYDKSFIDQVCSVILDLDP